jgi:hypothetical protein
VTLSSGKPAPDSVFLTGVEGILETVRHDRTLTTQALSDLDRFRSDLSVVDIFREVDAWKVFTRYFPGAVNFEQELAVRVSVVDHKVEHIERSKNVVY